MARTVTLTTESFSANYVVQFDNITDWNDLELEELTQVHAGQNRVQGNLFRNGEDIFTGEGDIVVENPATTTGELIATVGSDTRTLSPGQSTTFRAPSTGDGEVSITSHDVTVDTNLAIVNVTVNNGTSISQSILVDITVNGSRVESISDTLSPGESVRRKTRVTFDIEPEQSLDARICSDLISTPIGD